MPRSPQWMDLYHIWFRGSSRGRNQLCGILLQSAHGFRFCEGSKFAISHWLGRSLLTQCWRYRAACDYPRPAFGYSQRASIVFGSDRCRLLQVQTIILQFRGGYACCTSHCSLSCLPPTKEEVNVFARVCLFVCLSVSRITQKSVHGFGWNVACRQMSGYGRID